MKGRIGKNMKAALEFAKRFSGWHTYARDRATTNAIEKLKVLGMITTNQYRQFRKVNAQ